MPTSLPKASRQRIWRATLIVTLISSLASVALAEVIMLIISRGLDIQGALASFILPAVLGAPVMYYMMLKTEQLRLANQRLRILAATDSLTGCLNRRAFSQSVDDLLQRPEAFGTFLVIDADHFKQVNDQFGHDIGDDVLQRIAEVLRQCGGSGAIVGRLGGEEFGILLPGCDVRKAQEIAEDIRLSVGALQLVAAPRYRLSVSIGGVESGPGATFSALFRMADQRLYGAKHAGRDRIDIDAYGQAA